MVTLKALSPATRTSTDLGASGTDVNAVVEARLQPIELQLRVYDVTLLLAAVATLNTEDANVTVTCAGSWKLQGHRR